MASEILAFIDEAGCSGDKFGNGSSEFLIMAAAMFRAVNEEEALSCFDSARHEGGHERRFRKFSKSTDKDRFALTRLMANGHIRIVQVALHKPSMSAPYIRTHHGSEYNYLFKMVLERISWFARDLYENKPGEGRTVHITLSEQKMYPYEEMSEYMEKLRKGGHNCSAEWNFIDPELSVLPHEDEHPIHLADYAASALHMACEPKQHQMTDDRFQRNLHPILYKRKVDDANKVYGLKFFPAGVEERLGLEFVRLLK